MNNIEKTTIQEISLEDVMGDRFGRYSKYIIQDRALPDIRDGLKPVQRRILYAMYTDGNTYDKQFRKSAKTVGNVIANYHPHGDSSVYDAMVRLSQDWKLRETLVDMHGNNGSMDGDAAAAMRYTEARLSKLSNELLKDIDKETVDFILNFDDTIEEPTVLPAKFPNLLVNGATGISAGYATDIPPHNLGEVIDATIHLIDKPQATVDELMHYIKGPDFPTGAIIQGVTGLREAYETGRGKVVVRSKTNIVEVRGGREQIVISEIPFDVNKAMLVKRMDEIRINKKIEGIAEVRDESDRNGLQIVVELKKDANAQAILNYLFKNTDLQIAYNFNMVAINNRRPEQVGLRHILLAYITHQKDVILRRTKFNLSKAKARLHIVDGLIKALSILDEVIVLIRNSKDKKDAKENLIKQFDFSQIQSEAIVSLQLYRLTNTDITALQNEKLDLNEEIASLELIINQDNILLKVLKKELKDVKKQYSTPRLSEIQQEISEIKIEIENLIPEEDVYVVITKGGYYKRVSLRSYTAVSNEQTGLREKDEIVYLQKVNTRQNLLLLTNKGNYIYLPVYDIPEFKWKDLGNHLTQQFVLDQEEIVKVVRFEDEQITKEATITMLTSDGMIKRTLLNEFVVFRSYKTKTAVAMKLRENAKIVSASVQFDKNDNQEVFVVSQFGFCLRYKINEVPIVGLKAAGVKAINLKADDYVVGGVVADVTIDHKPQILLVTQRGNAKKVNLMDINILGRAKRGLMLLKEIKSKPHHVVYISDLLAKDDEYQVFNLNTSEIIQVSKMNASERTSNGSNIIDEEVIQVIKVK